jgi:ATP-dependent Lon protease
VLCSDVLCCAVLCCAVNCLLLLQRDELNLTRASGVLDRDHLGLRDVKEQILEFIAVGKLKDQLAEGGGARETGAGAGRGRGRDSSSDTSAAGGGGVGKDSEREASRSITSKVLCLVGPPG